jgi:hypothetical protein
VSNPKSSNNAWQIFITDILDTDNDIQVRGVTKKTDFNHPWPIHEVK